MSLKAERALFDACVGLPAGEREAWLNANCADPALRERVLRLLKAHDAAEESGALQSAPAMPPPPQIGPYRLIERIGEGAMGEVYLAEQQTPVRRRVALKVIKPGMDSREVIARFDVERQTLALMSHPSITHIIDAGTTDGRPYFAMEYVPGIPLTKYCDQHRLSIDERLKLFLQICDAVQHAHQKGVIHRDLKPSNLLVTDLDGRPIPKVIDFGIAKAVAMDQTPSRAHTRMGHIIGTPEYMSPEQAQLSPLDVDTRSDVYSLGVVLHELLTGLLPFETTDPNATPAQLVRELLTHDPAAPSARLRVQKAQPVQPEDSAAQRRLSLRQLTARLAGDLDWIVLKALEKDRNRRYGSPSELAADIRRHLENQPVIAGPPSTVYRMRKFAVRHRLALAIAGVLFGAAVVFGALMARQAHEIAQQRDQARFHAQRAEASSEFMSLMLEEVGPAGKPLTPLELLDKGVELLEKRYGADPHFAARMLVQMSRRYMDLGSTDRQAQVLSRAEAIAKDLHDDELLAEIQCTLVRTDLDANRYEQAKQRMASARATLTGVSDAHVATQVDCLRAEADIAELGREIDAALTHLDRARVLLEESHNTRGLQYHAVLTDLGGIYYRSGRYKEALALNEQTAEALDRNGRGGTLGRITLIVNRSTLLSRLGEVREAHSVMLDALRRSEALRGNKVPTPSFAVSYGILLNRLEQAGEAMNVLDAAREQSRALGNGYLDAVATYQLGRSLMIAGQLEAARARMEDAQRLWLEDEMANRDRLADLSRSLAELELIQQRPEAARPLIEQSLQQYDYPRNQSGLGLSGALVTAARIYLKSGEPEKARSFAEAALRLSESVAREPRNSADVGEALLMMAHARQAMGDGAGARQATERAVETLTNGLGSNHRLTREAIDLKRAQRT
jgi:eukaryotic-like serine/threonine-protein kinase